MKKPNGPKWSGSEFEAGELVHWGIGKWIVEIIEFNKNGIWLVRASNGVQYFASNIYKIKK